MSVEIHQSQKTMREKSASRPGHENTKPRQCAPVPESDPGLGSKNQCGKHYVQERAHFGRMVRSQSERTIKDSFISISGEPANYSCILQNDKGTIDPNQELRQKGEVVMVADESFPGPEEDQVLQQAERIQAVGVAGIYKIGSAKDSRNRKSHGRYGFDPEV